MLNEVSFFNLENKQVIFIYKKKSFQQLTGLQALNYNRIVNLHAN